MTLPANIRVNVRVPFPTRVGGAAFISVNKANGIWTIAPNYRLLAPDVAITPTQVVAVQDLLTGVFSYAYANALGSGGGGGGGVVVPRMITVAGATVVLAADTALLINPSPGGAVTIQLLPSAGRAGIPLIIKDYSGLANTNNITITPASGETIEGLSAAAAVANGIAVIDTDYGSKSLYPLTSDGWFIS